jgi:hypothetical protein
LLDRNVFLGSKHLHVYTFENIFIFTYENNKINLLSYCPQVPDIRPGALSMLFVLCSMCVQLYLQKYPIFVLFLDKIKYPNCLISQYEYRYDPWYCHHCASDIIVCRSHRRYSFTFQYILILCIMKSVRAIQIYRHSL